MGTVNSALDEGDVRQKAECEYSYVVVFRDHMGLIKVKAYNSGVFD